MKTSAYLSLMLLTGALGAAGCNTAPKTEAGRDALKDDSSGAMQRLENEDTGFKSFLDRAHGYVVFPNVGKGGIGVGGAYGKGIVYEQGQMVGYADLTQATIGLQLGGQEYTEIIAFETKDALDKFENNQLEFDASASAVALHSGAAATAKYTNGVAVFTKPKAGLMFEASIGGQKFTFKRATAATPAS